MIDKVKLAIAVALVGAGIWAYYWLSETALVLRILAVVVFIAGIRILGSALTGE